MQHEMLKMALGFYISCIPLQCDYTWEHFNVEAQDHF